ncbi:MAG: anthranilate synthase component I family protein [Sedimentisphaerales bacterium]|nr:anthranilate synthase component I family protein [Sedimentisphaerales bacterium]
MTTAVLPIKRKIPVCRLHCRKLNLDIDLPSLSEVVSKLPQAAILGGNPSKLQADGFSCWMAKPVEIFEFHAGQKEPFEKLQSFLNKYKPVKNIPENLPKGLFAGGWVGFFSYDLGRFTEPTAFPDSRVKDDLMLPLIRLLFYDRLIALDHRNNEFWLIVLELDGDSETPQEKLTTIANLLDKARAAQMPGLLPADLENVDFSHISSNITKDYYLRAFEKIKRHIYDGDVYQINFSQRFNCEYHARPIDLFHWQNRYNPSPYSAYINAGGFQIVSASPEMFITIRDRSISTKPIKGTRKRLETASGGANRINAENFQQLLNSEKEKAELNMIIDLERNDVARICIPGTRLVSQPRTIETHPSVFHAVATVSGRLRDDVNFCGVLKAMFPGGSITGAPKIRSMQIIDETEPAARGVYTGSIGYIGLDDSVCLNIAIRTIIIKNNSAYVQTGGGIVADSDPQAEYDETLIKARALLAGTQAVNS